MMLSRPFFLVALSFFILIQVNGQVGRFSSDSVLVQSGWDAYKIKDSNKALGIFKSEAEKGNPVAQEIMGIFYLTGQIVKQDSIKAVYWITRSAEQDFPDAMYNLGVFYFNDRDIKNDSIGFYWMNRSASIGNAIAAHDIGIAYNKGIGVTKNDSLSFMWFIQSINLGLSEAENSLFTLYGYDKKIAKMVGEYRIWGHRFLNGEANCIKNSTFGFKLLQQDAINTSNPESYYLMAQCYENGTGVAKDIKKAVDMYTMAMIFGKKEAQADMDRLGNKQ